MRPVHGSAASRRLVGRWSAAAAAWVVAALCAGTMGQAQAQVSVSADGQPGFSYPIAVPPGIAGMQPNLSLVYSGGGNGPLGVGWVLAGTSVIARCPATKDVDGIVRGVSYAPPDKICLDGQRLVQTDAQGNALSSQADDSLGLAGTGWREFRTEKDSFARIRAYGSAADLAANGPAYFKMWTKGGQILEYGSSPGGVASNAQIRAQGRSVVAAWALSRTTELTGNYIDFKYTAARDTAWGSRLSGAAAATTGSEWNLAEVQYTGNRSVSPEQAPTVKVVFSYTDRPSNDGGPQDRSELFHQGSKSLNIQRLSEVRTYVNSANPGVLGPAEGAVQVKVMKLAYELGPVTKRSRLVSITDCVGAGGTLCAPPFKFGYSAGGDESYERNSKFNLYNFDLLKTGVGPGGVIPLDFDGDGRTDLLRWTDSSNAPQVLWRSRGDGAFIPVGAENPVTQGPFNIQDRLNTVNGCYYTVAMDFNGDMRADLLRLMRAAATDGSSCGTVRHILFLSRGDGTFSSQDVTGIDFTQKASVLAARYSGCRGGVPLKAESPMRVVDPEPCEPELLGYSQTEGRNYHILDINADGLPDIVTTLLPGFGTTANSPTEEQTCASTTCTRIYLGRPGGGFVESTASNVTHRSLYAAPPATTASVYNALRRANIADVNGDGVADIIGNSGIWLSRGDGNFDLSSATSGSLVGCAFPLDFNADGRADCLVPSVNAAASQTLWVSDGTNGAKKLGNFNLTAADQLLMGSASTTALNTGVELIGGFDGAPAALLRWRDDATQNKLYLSNGDGTFRTSTSFNLNTAARGLGHSDGKTDILVADFTGSGQSEILRLKDSPTGDAVEASSNVLYVRSHKAEPADLLTSVTTPTGAITSVVYAKLLQSGRYTIDSGDDKATYPKYDLNSPMPVIVTLNTDSGLLQPDGKPLYVQTEYAYKGLKGSFAGRGMLGFREIRQQSNAPNGDPLTIVTESLQDHPYIGNAGITRTLRGTLAQTDAAEISRTESTYCDMAANLASAAPSPLAPCPLPAGTKITRPYLYKAVETGHDLDPARSALPTVTTTNTYNTTGDLKEVVTVTTGTALGLAQTFTKINTNEYEPDKTDGDQWILGRLKSSKVRSIVPNSLPAIGTSPGTSPTASDGIGAGPVPPLNPAVLNVILQLLLDD
jgi:hypothetical protein